MIFVLDATNKALKFTVSDGTDVHFTSHWADATASGLTEGQTHGTSNGSTAVDAVPAPAASTRRVVKLITFHNTNTTTSRTVTLVNDVGGTSRTIAVFTLAPLATWYSDTAATTAIADGDKGDITVSASGATWTIDNNAITTAKILDANVTFAKIANITSGNLLGRTSGGSGPVQEITPGTGVLTWLQTPTADNLRSAVTGDTGTGNLVFADAPTITSPTISTGNLRFSSTAQFIEGDLSGPVADRLKLRTTTTNGSSTLFLVPNGTGVASSILCYSRENVNFSTFLQLVCVDTTGAQESRINSGINGQEVTAIPLVLQVGGTSRLRLETDGNIGFNGKLYSNGVGVIHIGNATTTPTVFPTSGGILYVTASGALRWRGPSTDTQIAPA